MSDVKIVALADVEGSVVTALHNEIFGPGRFARTAFRVREAAGVDARLSFAALSGTTLVGTAAACAIVDDAGLDGVLIGPIAVAPDFERQGIGTALVSHALNKIAERYQNGFAALVGDHSFYERFGFAPLPGGSVRLPGPVDTGRLLFVVFGDQAPSGTLRAR